MILKQINIINFGQLSNLTFDLPSDELNLFFGQNEAGKSTTVAFIKQVLFGFYLRSNSSPFFEDYKPLAHVSPMGGSLIFTNNEGSEFKLERLWAKGDKTKKGILTVFKDGQKVPENLFFDQIRNIDGNFYADSFIFNQEMLTQVAKLNQEDLLERIYYLGAANSNQLLTLRDEFNKKANDLFKKTGKKPEVNQLLKQLDEKRANLEINNQEFEEYQELSRKLHKKEELLSQSQNKVKKLQGKINNTKKIEDQYRIYEQVQDLTRKEKKVDFNSEYYQQAHELVARKDNLQLSIDRLNRQIAAIQEDENVDSSKLRELVQKRAELLQWQSNLKTNEQNKKEIQLRAQELLQINPEIKELINLENEDIQRLSETVKKLQEPPAAASVSQNSKMLFMISGIIAIFSIIEIFSNVFIGSLGLIVGLAILALNYQNSQKSKRVQEEAQKNYQAKIFSFKEKYHFDPQEVNFRDLISARNNYLIKENNLKNINLQIAQINRQVKLLAENVSKVTHATCSNECSDILTKLNQLEEKMRDEERRQEQLVSLKVEKKDLLQKAKELELQLKTIFAKDKVKDLNEYDKRYQESLQQAKLKVQINALKNSLSISYEKLEKVKISELRQVLLTVKSEIDSQNLEINSLQQAIAELQVKMKNMADSAQVFKAKQDLANTKTKFLNASKDYLSYLLAAKWIGRSLDIASNERFPKMLKSACDYFKLLTGGRYTELQLGKKLAVTRRDGKKRDVRYLSRATAEQLYFALKLAFVEQIKDQINLPILIDDSFVNFDDQRIDYIDELLKKIGEHNQVLIFTAQEKLSQKLGITPLLFRKDTANA